MTTTDGTKPPTPEPLMTLLISLSSDDWMKLAVLLGTGTKDDAMQRVAHAVEKAVALVQALPMIVKAPLN